MITDEALRSLTFFTASDHAPCTFYAVVSYEMTYMASQILFAPKRSIVKSEQAELSDTLHQISIDKYISSCTCVDSPLCRLTIEWCSIYRDRLRLLLLYGDKIFLRKVTPAPDATNSNQDLLTCIQILEKVRDLRDDPTYSRWAWLWHNCVEWVRLKHSQFEVCIYTDHSRVVGCGCGGT